MKFGVNYTPATDWFHSWFDLNLDDTRRDLDQITRLGVDHIRIFPLWPVVQPNRTLIRDKAMADILAVVDLAAERNLDVNVDVIQGHLSSFDFLPAWITTWHQRNMFTDPEVVRAEAELTARFARDLAGRSNVLGITLGNELNQFGPPVHPDMHEVTSAQAAAWLETLTEAARTAGSTLVTNALYDATWYDDGQPFLPEFAARIGDATVAHSWVFNGAAQTFGALHPGSTRHAEYLLKLSSAWHRDDQRPVWLQEVGAPTTVVPKDQAPDFLEQTIRNALTTQNLMGVTWWCSHDVSRSLGDFPEVEYDLGLYSSEGELKPTGQRFAQLVEEFKHADSCELASGEAPVVELDDGVANYRSKCAPGGEFHRQWLALAERASQGPTVRLSSNRDA